MRAGALQCLTELVTQQNVIPPIDATSAASVTALARDLMAARGLSFMELSGAAVLAIATREPQLRDAAARLADPGELHARGIDGPTQNIVIKAITEALAKFPAR
jgi:hypothetical protein